MFETNRYKLEIVDPEKGLSRILDKTSKRITPTDNSLVNLMIQKSIFKLDKEAFDGFCRDMINSESRSL